MAAKKRLTHLGVYSDLVAAAQRAHSLYGRARPGVATQAGFLAAIGMDLPPKPKQVRRGTRWVKDGVAGEVVSWSVGYGPRTQGWLLRPAKARGPLPGVIALHDHGGFKTLGKEKIADGPAATSQEAQDFRNIVYGGLAFANDLARQGFAVLVHDVFLWGSRRFPLVDMPAGVREIGLMLQRSGMDPGTPQGADTALYNITAAEHEHIVEKYCHLLGISLAGVLAYEDRVAAAYLRSRRDVAAGGLGCVGLSGGGMRAVLMQATCAQIKAAVVVGAMSTWEDLLDHNVVCHTWAMLPATWARKGCWSDAAACRAPSPLLVQYDREDPLYTLEGQEKAHRRIAQHYRDAGAPANYLGKFYPGLHKFDAPMQHDAFTFLGQHLAPSTAHRAH